MPIGIVSYGCYLPIYRIKTEEIAKAHFQNPIFIKKSLNIEEKTLPNIDEDSATMAVEAAKNCLNSLDSLDNFNRDDIGSIYLGSESHPYAVKPTGSILAAALKIKNYSTADLQFACKAGTEAIKIALSEVKSNFVKYSLIGGSDTAQAEPGDILEYSAGAGSAVFLIGNENVIAEINHFTSFTTDTPDFWRRQHEKFPKHAGTFTGEPAYFKHILTATKLLFEKAKTKPDDYDYAVFHQPNGKFPFEVAKLLGFKKEQVMPSILVNKIGNTYSASSLLGLCAVLEIAKPGNRILLTSYGSGAGSDSFDITIKDEILKFRELKKKNKTKSLDYYLNKKIYVDYFTYLKNTGKF
ncbi:MAG: hydroxymethylglutaryl-CoA synthase [Candidatus Woesearchaeota archaeon]